MLVAAVVSVSLMATIGASKAVVTFRVSFGFLLSLLGCIQLYVATKLFLNRRNSLVKLSQPIGLSLFAVAGSISMATSFLLARPESDATYALRQPIILTCA